MNNTEIIILAAALALDALIVSFSYGLIICASRFKNSFFLAAAFGFFQFLMPVLGWNLTGIVYSGLELYSKWIVFLVFLILGVKFLINALTGKEEGNTIMRISPLCLLWLALATSIDALGAGISIRFINISILKPSIIIGGITFLLSFISFWAANMFKRLPVKCLEITGALLLMYLAVKAVI